VGAGHKHHLLSFHLAVSWAAQEELEDVTRRNTSTQDQFGAVAKFLATQNSASGGGSGGISGGVSGGGGAGAFYPDTDGQFADSVLPWGWVKGLDPVSGHHYFIYEPTAHTQWEAPPRKDTQPHAESAPSGRVPPSEASSLAFLASYCSESEDDDESPGSTERKAAK
jgi:hypothetical protein